MLTGWLLLGAEKERISATLLESVEATVPSEFYTNLTTLDMSFLVRSCSLSVGWDSSKFNNRVAWYNR